jgi:hypothetical protein
MPKHAERPATTLAHGAAKPDDIERARRDVVTAEGHNPVIDRSLGEMEAACETIRQDVEQLKRAIVAKR